MLEPTFATAVMLSVSFLLLVVIPLLDGSKRFSKYISLRYTLVSVSLIMALGCILNFSHLADRSRDIVLVGALSIVGMFVLLRSLEKMKLGNKTFEVSAEKNGLKVEAKLSGKNDKVEVEENISEDADANADERD